MKILCLRNALLTLTAFNIFDCAIYLNKELKIFKERNKDHDLPQYEKSQINRIGIGSDT